MGYSWMEPEPCCAAHCVERMDAAIARWPMLSQRPEAPMRSVSSRGPFMIDLAEQDEDGDSWRWHRLRIVPDHGCPQCLFERTEAGLSPFAARQPLPPGMARRAEEAARRAREGSGD